MPDVYRAARYIPEESSGFYVIPVPAGRYQLQLHFIEGLVKNANERISNTWIQIASAQVKSAETWPCGRASLNY